MWTAALEIQKLEADIQKARADRRNAELECRDLEHWYLRPAVPQPWAAIVLGVVTGLIGTASGCFSTKLESLNNTMLNNTIRKLKSSAK
jgi:hypothetical protein